MVERKTDFLGSLRKKLRGEDDSDPRGESLKRKVAPSEEDEDWEEDEDDEQDERDPRLVELENLKSVHEVLEKVEELFLSDEINEYEIELAASQALRTIHPEISAQFLIAAMRRF